MFFILNTYFCDKNGFLPFKFGYLAKIENLTLGLFFKPIFVDNIFNNFPNNTEWVRNMNMSFQSKIMIIKNISNGSVVQSLIHNLSANSDQFIITGNSIYSPHYSTCRVVCFSNVVCFYRAYGCLSWEYSRILCLRPHVMRWVRCMSVSLLVE